MTPKYHFTHYNPRRISLTLPFCRVYKGSLLPRTEHPRRAMPFSLVLCPGAQAFNGCLEHLMTCTKCGQGTKVRASRSRLYNAMHRLLLFVQRIQW